MATKKKSTPPKKKDSKNKLKSIKGGKQDIPPELTKDDVHENGNGQEKEKKEKKKKDVGKVEKPKTALEEISAVKLDKKGFLSITYSIVNTDGSSVDRPDVWHNRIVHPDLRQRLRDLRPHLALLCGYLSKQLLKDINNYSEELLETFEVRGVRIGPNHEWYIVKGLNKNFAGGNVTLNTPKQNVEASEETAYRYMDDLEEKIEELLKEVKLYATGEKVGQAQQTEMDFPTDASEEEEKEFEEDYAEEGR